MSRNLAFTILLLAQSTVGLAEPRLLGSWRSDALLTIQSIEQIRELTAEERERFEQVLGNMTMTFRDETVRVEWGEPGSKPMSVPYKVLDSGENHVTVEFDDRQGDTQETVKYRFEGDCIKRRLIPEGWFEYFCKVD